MKLGNAVKRGEGGTETKKRLAHLKQELSESQKHAVAQRVKRFARKQQPGWGSTLYDCTLGLIWG